MQDNDGTTAQEITSEPFNAWWQRQADRIGTGGCIVLTSMEGGIEIQTVGSDWSALVNAGSSMVARACRMVGMEEWAADITAQITKANVLNQIVETLASELAKAKLLASASFEPELEPPY